MSILKTNLKHLYQKRSFWLIGLAYGFFAFAVIVVIAQAVARNKQGGFSAPVLWMLFVNVFIATLPLDVLTKPFSYCLPGHRAIPWKFLFVIGITLSFLWSLSFLFYPGLNFAKTILTCLSAFSIFTIFYWLGAWVVFRFRNWSIVFAFLPLIIFGGKLLSLSMITEYAIVESPLLMILLGGLVNFSAWRYWGRPSLARRYCGKFWMGTFDAWNKEKLSKFKQVRLAEKDKKKPNLTKLSPAVEAFFLSRISASESDSFARYIWAGLYRSFGRVISQREDWARFLIVFLPILCFLGYLGPGGNIIFFMPGIMIASMSLWVRSSFLTSGGRPQRFWSALVLAITTSVLVTVAVVLIALVTIPMENLLPELTIKGNSVPFHALELNFFFVPLLMIPVVFTIGLIFHRKPILQLIFVIGFFQILFFLSLFKKLTIMNWPVQISTVLIMITILCLWGVFAAVLRYISMRCCLVGQSR